MSTTISFRPYGRGFILLALAIGGFGLGTTEFTVMSLLPFISRDLGVDEPTAGHVVSAYALGVVVGAPVIATLAGKLSRKVLLVALMGLFVLANGASGLAPSYEWLFVFRFLSGLPHGAYFGIAALVAASYARPGRRSQAVANMMLGLTIATIVGVPFANGMGQWLGWRWTFAVIAFIGILTMSLIQIGLERDEPRKGASPLAELGALKSRQVWLTLGIGAIGFGGMFAVYTYLASTLTQVTRLPAESVPIYLAIFGAGMTLGNLFVARIADRAQMPSIGGVLAWSMISLAVFTQVAEDPYLIGLAIFMIGCGGGLATPLQTRLMDVAGHAQALAAALNHSAFNTANALGPWLGGLAITAGFGWTSTGWVGVGLAFGGVLIWCLAFFDDRRRETRCPVPAE